MTVKDYLSSAIGRLSAAGISTARLDMLVLLEDVLNTNRTQLLARPETKIAEVDVKKLDKLVAKRSHHVPLAYLRGKTEFYGREFIINENVLEPRPESETMIDTLKTTVTSHPKLDLGSSLKNNAAGIKSNPDSSFHWNDEPLTIVDVGTGSGALAITAKLELPAAKVIATDIDANCLKLARRNAKRLSADINFTQGDLLEPMTTNYKLQTTNWFAILANLPYVPDNFQINTAALHEPRLAIFGGPDGLDLYRRLFDQIKQLKAKPRYILTEAMPPQHNKLAKIAQQAGYRLDQTDDFVQVFTCDPALA